MKTIVDRHFAMIMAGCAMTIFSSCSDDDAPSSGGASESGRLNGVELSVRNAERAMELVDAAVENYFSGTEMAMSRYYNPYTETRSGELGSVWMYTSSIEAVNAVLKALTDLKAAGIPALYEQNFTRYKELLASLYDNAEYYVGTFTHTSYTGTRSWAVYGVDRGSSKGGAFTEGIHNVYDDQMWLIRELVEAYHLTGENRYLERAEYLTEYVIDGWDSTLDENGRQHGGFTWGPGYVTKHSCSNGPMVSPFVWLSEIYKGKADEITYGVVNPDNSRGTATAKKADFYLDMAKATYEWQKTHLLDPEHGVYSDMMGGDENGGAIQYEEVGGTRYRAYSVLHDRAGAPLSYNTGSMLSGATDLYRVTRRGTYFGDIISLADCSFNYFASPSQLGTDLYEFDVTGFNNWFNGVLMRAYVEATAVYNPCQMYAEAFQANLDYAYDNYLYKHMLPSNLLVGWSRDRGHNNTQGMFIFSYAAQYALLASYQIDK